MSLQTPEQVIDHALHTLRPHRLALASSFSPEDVLVADLVLERHPDLHILSLDTGRLPTETLTYAIKLQQSLGWEIHWIHPPQNAVRQLEADQSPEGFRDSVEARHRCCQVRKVKPLAQALKGFDVWLTGLRRDQALSRGSLEAIEREVTFDPDWKINPLIDLNRQEVLELLDRRNLPQHPLTEQGFASIGCAPCTRPIVAGEHERAGRWWWEKSEHKECGLHNAGGSQ